MNGATATTPAGAAGLRRDPAPVVEPPSVALERGMGDDVEDALLQVPLESIHDRQHRDQRHDPEGDAGHRDTGDEADEAVVAARAQVPEPDPAADPERRSVPVRYS